MRFAVLGVTGQLGPSLCIRLELLGERVEWLTRADLDLERPDAIVPTLDAIRPDVVVNCAAYDFVDKGETEPDRVFAVNAWGGGALARACRSAGVKFVHFGTDYVFGLDATRATPWAEDDPPGPVNVYGVSKLAGEYLVRAEYPDALIVRTCGLYGLRGAGGKGGNFVETMLRLAGRGQPIRVVNDQRCTPSYTVDVASATVALMRSGAMGVYHVTNAGSCTWYEFAAEIFRQSGLTPDLIPIASAGRNDPARRPAYSVLSTAKLSQQGIPAPRPWQEALAAYLLERRTRVA